MPAVEFSVNTQNTSAYREKSIFLQKVEYKMKNDESHGSS